MIDMSCVPHKRSLLFASLLVVVLVSSCFISVFSSSCNTSFFVLGASDKVIVRDETELRNAITNAPTNKPTTITLDNDITLTQTTDGQDSNDHPANIVIPTDKDITLTSNKANGYYKLTGAVNGIVFWVACKGILRIDGVTITHTSNTIGRGVSIDTRAECYLYNGIISGNNAYDGAGVSNDGGIFVMSGGEISGNTAKYGGGGVSNNGVFTMSGGTISNNTADSGGGVLHLNYGEFTMSGGTISGNKAAQRGGGVYIGTGFIMTKTAYVGPIFTMSGGKISGNTATLGGGVYDSCGGLVRQGGVISGNTATNAGNDVYLEGSGNDLPDGNDGASNGNNNNSSSDNNNSGESNGNNETTNSDDGFSLKDIVITCVITIVVTLCIVLFVLLVSSQKRLRQIEKKQSKL